MAPIDLIDENLTINNDKTAQDTENTINNNSEPSNLNSKNANLLLIKSNDLNEIIITSEKNSDQDQDNNSSNKNESNGVDENDMSNSSTTSSSSISPTSTHNSDINSNSNNKLETVNENNQNLDDINSNHNNDETLTPTNISCNNNANEFYPFHQTPQPTSLPPPNSLALRTNLNSTKSQNPYNNNQYVPGQIIYPHHQFMHPQIYSPYMETQQQQQQQQQPVAQTPSSSTVFVHVDVGHLFQLQLGDKIKEIVGPATVKIVSNDGSKPVPLQLATPAPGQLIQQIVDENGILTDLIISSQQQPNPVSTPPTSTTPNSNSNTLITAPNHHLVNHVNTNSNTIHTFYPYQLTSPTHHPHHHSHPAYPPVITSSQNYMNESNKSSIPVNENSIETETTNSNTINQLQQQSVSPSSSSSCSSSTSTSNSNNYQQQQQQPQQQQQQQHLPLNNYHQYIHHHHHHLTSQVPTLQPPDLIPNDNSFNANNNNTPRKYIKINNFYLTNNNNLNEKSKQLNSIKLNRKYNNQSASKVNINNNNYIKTISNNNSNKFVYYNNSNKSINQINKKIYYNNSSNSISQMYESQQQKTVNNKNTEEPIMSNDLTDNNNNDTDELSRNLKFYQQVLSQIKEPHVCDIEARSVLVRLTPIELDTYLNSLIHLYNDNEGEINSTGSNLDSNENNSSNNSSNTSKNNELIIKIFENLNYTLELSSNEQQTFNKVYTGDANEITLKDLRPNTKYFLRVFASLSLRCRGEYTQAVSFHTKICQPDQPASPKLTGTKKKNELTLRWSNPPNDNGSKILDFILEYQEILNEIQDDPNKYVQIYKGPQKQFIVKKLKPSQCYAFRLACENQIGVSEFSKPVFIYTSGAVPSIPEPPQLVDSTISSLTLQWGAAIGELDYELQMMCEENQDTYGGFMTIYNGNNLIYRIGDLKRATNYLFRLRSQNDEGASQWCEIRKFKTMCDRPCRPLKLRIIKDSNSNYKFSWDRPRDDGGSPILAFQLYFNDDMLLYEGPLTEFMLEEDYIKNNLKSGHNYSVRVSCSNLFGQSETSDVLQFITPASQPNKCTRPEILFSKATKNIELRLSTNPVEDDGGSPILYYEFRLKEKSSSDGKNAKSNEIIQKLEANNLNNYLMPAREYELEIRAVNKIGPSEWSDKVEFTSGAACPDQPQQVQIIQQKSSNSLLIQWKEPESNGSPITEYRLEWCQKTVGEYQLLYSGLQLKHEIRANSFVIQPATNYLFRLQALNSCGASQFSLPTECLSPPSVPSAIQSIKLDELKSDCVKIIWRPPNSNGSPILHYNLDLSELNNNTNNNNNYTVIYNDSQQSGSCDYLIDMLQPDTQYKMRLQAANSCGVGQFSNMIKFRTKCLPPHPPNLELVSSSYNFIKLKWISTSNNNSNSEMNNQEMYNLEMKLKDETDDQDCMCVYNGTLNAYKVNKLKESSEYLFRISASNETGQGKWSQWCKFATTKSPPLINKPPLVSELTINSCLVEWNQPSVGNEELDEDQLEYCLQMNSNKNSEYKEVYRGRETRYRLANLESNHDYSLRVCALRNNSKINSPFSPSCSFTTLKQHKLLSTNYSSETSATRNSNSNRLNESERAGSKKSLLNSKKAKSTFLSSFFSKLMWPSFYLNLNDKSLNERRAIRFNDENNTTSLAHHSKRAGKNNGKLVSNETHSSLNNSALAVSSDKLTSDKCWAISFVIIFVLICFAMAFFMEKVYNNLTTVNTSTFPSTDQPASSSNNIEL